MAARSLRDLYDEFRAANGIRDNRPGKILDEGAMSKLMQLFLAFGVQVKASDIHLEPIAAGARVRLVKGQSCILCNGTGYVGRLGLFELPMLTDELRQLILERATHHIYRGALSGSKLRTMLVDGLEKAAQGMTTLEEVLRVMDESEMEDLAG